MLKNTGIPIEPELAQKWQMRLWIPPPLLMDELIWEMGDKLQLTEKPLVNNTFGILHLKLITTIQMQLTDVILYPFLSQACLYIQHNDMLRFIQCEEWWCFHRFSIKLDKYTGYQQPFTTEKVGTGTTNQEAVFGAFNWFLCTTR